MANGYVSVRVVCSQAVLKMVLARPGGSFWSVKGRRWQAEEAKQAAFAQERAKTRMLNTQQHTSGVEAAAEEVAAEEGAAEEARSVAGSDGWEAVVEPVACGRSAR